MIQDIYTIYKYIDVILHCSSWNNLNKMSLHVLFWYTTMIFPYKSYHKSLNDIIMMLLQSTMSSERETAYKIIMYIILNDENQCFNVYIIIFHFISIVTMGCN